MRSFKNHFFWIKLIVFICCVSALGACRQSTQQKPADTSAQSGETLWTKANGLRLKSKIYRSVKLSSRPVLVVVLHGDLLGVRAIPATTYHYVFAQNASMQMDNLVVAALLRPGYRDSTGEQSEGERGLTTGDNYTPQVVDAVAQAIEQLKNKFHPMRTVLVGHSGGAAITGDLLSRWPSAADAALMVSCPCDLTAWRKHMQQMQNNNPIWSAPIQSLSPIDLASKVPPSIHVQLLVGSKDPVAPPEISEHYAEALRSHGSHVALTIAPGLEHDILLEPVTMNALKAVVGVTNK